MNIYSYCHPSHLWLLGDNETTNQYSVDTNGNELFSPGAYKYSGRFRVDCTW